MNFGEQIKNIRSERKLTQEQMAEMLNVSRQAVSNWENNRNLPDIEMLITMARVFNLSLDQLILGGTDMNNMTEKLIKDGGESHRARMNLISICIGAVLLLIGIASLALKAVSVEYVDTNGILHDNFFLLPTAFLFLFSGFIVFVVTGVKNITLMSRAKSDQGKSNHFTYIGISLGVVLLCIGGFFILLEVNSGMNTAIPGIILILFGIVCFVWTICKSIFRKDNHFKSK
jgi:transcriptional regulator with XRE-family HTH domain